MRITFVLPMVNMSGGIKVVAIYAKYLQQKGHQVVLVSPPATHPSLSQKLKNFVKGKGWYKPFIEQSHLDNTGLDHRILEVARPVSEADVPDADVVIATWWETAETVNILSKAKGAKVYFIQHHEVVFDHLPQHRPAATYRMPLHKIVIARWLQDVMRDEYGDNHVDLVPNSVDTQQFYAPPRQKQSVPTIGFLFNCQAFKGVDVTLAAIARLRESFPRLRVISFGSEPVGEFSPWDERIEFTLEPPQEKIRDFYAQCDVWITASRSEGFNLPAMEAMACRTPVVSTRAGWPMEAIVSYQNGVLTAVDDVDALTEAARWVLSRDQATWQSLSNQAHATATQGSWAQSAEQFEKALTNAVNAA